MNLFIFRLLSLLLLSLLCVSVAVHGKEKPLIPNSQKACEAKGGAWTTLGLPYPNKPKVCDLKASDVGKKCEDSSECDGVCLAKKTSIEGQKTTGQCSEYVSNYGSLLLVNKGTVKRLDVE